MTDRVDGRTPDELRPITIERGWSAQAEGSALISFGSTKVLCTASFTNGVPRWLTEGLANVHFWTGMVGILFYILSMWIAGVTQGLMWKEFTADGVLTLALDPSGPRYEDAAELDADVARYREALTAGTVCGRCRSPNTAGSRFCAECGARLPAADTR